MSGCYGNSKEDRYFEGLIPDIEHESANITIKFTGNDKGLTCLYHIIPVYMCAVFEEDCYEMTIIDSNETFFEVNFELQSKNTDDFDEILELITQVCNTESIKMEIL